MGRIFLVKRDPRRPAGKDNWIRMNCSQFAEFMLTPEGRARKRGFGIVEACGGDSMIVIETDGDAAGTLRSENNRRCYVRRSLRRALERYGMHLVDLGDEEITSCRSQWDSPETVEEAVEIKMDLQYLREAVRGLERDEITLLRYCVISDDPMTERMYGEITGCSREEVHAKKRRILRKLRKELQEKIVC